MPAWRVTTWAIVAWTVVIAGVVIMPFWPWSARAVSLPGPMGTRLSFLTSGIGEVLPALGVWAVGFVVLSLVWLMHDRARHA